METVRDSIKRYIAVDIGASSGRHLYAEYKDGALTVNEIFRFSNGVTEKNGRICWDIDSLLKNIIEGLRFAHLNGYDADYIAVDTFGVDFILLDTDNEPVSDFVAYRDHRTDNYENDVEEKTTFRKMYSIAGIQKMAINSVHQLIYIKKHEPELLEKAEKLIFIPDYINYALTGKITCEYTDASTSGLLDAQKRDWSDELIDIFGLPRKIFIKPTLPGIEIGPVKDEIAGYIGFCPKILLVATHDTGSAVLSVPDPDSIYLSCGTWSLIGISIDDPNLSEEAFKENFTNEGGFSGDIRFLRNITGLWIIQSLKKESGLSYDEIMNMAKENIGTKLRIDINHPDFLSPKSMTKAIKSHLPENVTDGELYAVVYISLAESYKRAAEGLESVCGRKFDTISLLGGGVKDPLLCELTERITGKKVIRGASEATALGNFAGQLIASGAADSISKAKEIILSAKIEK
ncbi:MAG: rhamnulokinase [Oscillospiraceae bacterium]|nr:rhamnulokinase [Oscillospiraceae bacterium]